MNHEVNALNALKQAFLVYPQTIKKEPRVAYAGTRGSYGEEASLVFFKQHCELFPFKTFEDVFVALSQGSIDYGVLPIENSSTGSIAAVYDLLSRYQYYIVGEEEIKARHCLLAPKGASFETIAEVYSHPQSFWRCGSCLLPKGRAHDPCFRPGPGVWGIQPAGCELSGRTGDRKSVV